MCSSDLADPDDAARLHVLDRRAGDGLFEFVLCHGRYGTGSMVNSKRHRFAYPPLGGGSPNWSKARDFATLDTRFSDEARP